MNVITLAGTLTGVVILAASCASDGAHRVEGSTGRPPAQARTVSGSATTRDLVAAGQRRSYVVIAPSSGRDTGKEWLSVIDLPEELNAIFCFTENQTELLCWTYEDPPTDRRGDAWLDARKVLVRIGDQRL